MNATEALRFLATRNIQFGPSRRFRENDYDFNLRLITQKQTYDVQGKGANPKDALLDAITNAVQEEENIEQELLP